MPASYVWIVFATQEFPDIAEEADGPEGFNVGFEGIGAISVEGKEIQYRMCVTRQVGDCDLC